MRNLMLLDRFRLWDVERAMYGGPNDRPDLGGIFAVPSPTGGGMLRVIVSIGYGWDHVSASLPNRCPNWNEMNKLARLFFKDDECPFQLHPPETDYVNNMPYCLHLWRSHSQEVPRPPAELVGIKGMSTETARALSQDQLAAIQDGMARQLMMKGHKL